MGHRKPSRFRCRRSACLCHKRCCKFALDGLPGTDSIDCQRRSFDHCHRHWCNLGFVSQPHMSARYCRYTLEYRSHNCCGTYASSAARRNRPSRRWCNSCSRCHNYCCTAETSGQPHKVARIPLCIVVRRHRTHSGSRATHRIRNRVQAREVKSANHKRARQLEPIQQTHFGLVRTDGKTLSRASVRRISRISNAAQ